MRRYQMPWFSARRLLSKIVDLFCGYGERPIRVMAFSLTTILTFAVCYAALGVSDPAGTEFLHSDSLITDRLQHFLTCVYFSVVTFTTLGYGDITPLGIARLFAAMEAFIGSFTLALFVVVFVKKMTR